GRDSLVVLPTGGGKSLCYQVPPVAAGRLDVVVSPLISLMKDQVDALIECGYPAAALHSNQTAAERAAAFSAAESGTCRLLYVSPERLATEEFLAWLATVAPGAFAVDEAHCISHWGHDFRPEYRQLRTIRERFPGVALHAFTATATPRVREDIALQLGLREPEILVGCFDRENLIYRVVMKADVARQTREVLSRHAGEAAIVYCLSRQDTMDLATSLAASGIRAVPYHAGLPAEARRAAQEAFATERADVIVATVAFGMGIDKSDVRCVIHASIPKSIEHYQQETGRAGRDGLPAECVLFYTYADVIRWQHLLSRSAAESAGDGAEEVLPAQLALLEDMKRLAGRLECRHRALSRYFGQPYERGDCGACDVCLGEAEGMAGSTETAQKILSAVARLERGFGVGYLVSVLRGSDADLVKSRGHDALSVYGLLRDRPEKTVTSLVYQLVEQGLLTRTDGDRPVLRLNADSVAVLKGRRTVHLVEPVSRRVKKTRVEVEAAKDVDLDLFERLRRLRSDLAKERGVPAYVIFHDRTLRDLAARRPTTLAGLGSVHGMGTRKLAQFGEVLLAALAGDGGDTAPPPASDSPSG
ncbi:MAG: RecQ family ATP-dependent DNA helicase, partial [Planctomycetes bacterium]|nr:RecQ family ATP-dependent DNA helicase [Planctomycetota bacterium]